MQVVCGNPVSGDTVMKHNSVLEKLVGGDDWNMVKKFKNFYAVAYGQVMSVQLFFDVLIRIPAGVSGT